MNEIMPFAATWIDLDYAMWNKSNREKQTSYDIPYIWNLENDTNELIYKQKQTHKLEKQTYVYERGNVRVGGGDKLGVWD